MTVTEWESGSYETASNGRGSGDGRCSGVVDSPTVSPVDRVSKQASPVPRPVNSSDPASSSEPKVITRQRLMADLQRVPIQSPMLECGSAAESGAPVGMVRSVAHEEAMVMLPRLPPSALTGVGLGDPAFQPGVPSLDMDGRFPANYRASASVSAGINEQSQHYAPNLPRPRLANSASTGNLDTLVAPPYHEQEYRAENRSFGRINSQSAHFRPEHTGHARYQHEYAARPSFMPLHPAMYSNESTVSNGHADLQMHQFQESPTVPLWQSMQTMSLRGDYTAGNAPKLISRQPAPQLVRHHSAESIAPSMNYHLHGQSFGTNSRSFRRQADGDGESQHRFANGHQMHLHDSMPHQMYMQPPMVQSHSANDSCRDFPPSLASHTTLSWRDTQMTGGFARPSPLGSPVMCPSRSMPPMASGSPRSHRHYAQSLSRPSSAASSHPPLDTPIVPRGQMLAMSRTQQGCRALQKLLDESAEHVVVVSALMLDELIGYFAALMTDPFGNYLAQKLIERCSRDDCQRIVMETANALPRIAMDSHGTRSVQRLVEQVRTNEQIIAVCESISPHVSRLIVDPNATHVIQKCLVHIPPRYLHFIFNAVAGDFVEVCRDRHGCCVAQRCMDHGEPEIVESLMHAVCTNVPKLIQDPFANYVVQYALKHGSRAHNDSICARFRGTLVRLSTHKFSSNVVEMALRMTDGDTRRMLLDELLAAKNLDRLVRDAFGSYCVQTAVDVVDEVERPMLLKRLVSYVIDDMHLRATTHGRRLMNKLAKYGCIVDPAPVFQSGPYIPDEHGDHRQYHQQHEVVPTHQDRYLRQFGNHY